MKNAELRTKMLVYTMEKLPIGVGIYKLTDKIEPIYISDRALEIFGVTRKEHDDSILPGTKGGRNVTVKEIEFKNFKVEHYINTKESYEKVYPAVKKDGTYIWVRTVSTFERDADDIFCYTTLVDVTEYIEELHEREKKDEIYKILIKESQMILFDYDTKTQSMVYSIPDLNGERQERRVDNYLANVRDSKVVHPDFRKSFIDILKAASEKVVEGSLEYLADFWGKGSRWYWASYKSIADQEGAVFRIVGRSTDIQEEKIRTIKLKNKAELDSLSSLYNRNTAADLINKTLANTAEEENYVFAVLDIDNFKVINDTYGHPAGDMVIKRISSALRDEFRRTDIVCRLGGDEFCVFFPTSDSAMAVHRKMESFIRKIKALSDNVKLGVKVSVSIGIAFAPKHGKSFDAIFKKADIALYEAKAKGKDTYIIYNGK